MKRAMILLAAALVLPAAGDDTLWTQPRGTASGAAVCRWAAEGPRPDIREWHFQSKGGRRYKMGLAVWASPALAVVRGMPMAFLGGYDQTMHALDLVEKEERWAKITNGEIGAPPAVGLVDGRQIVFWGSAGRSVYAYTADTGRRLWTRELIPPTSTLIASPISAPLLDGRRLYITAFAHDKALGRNAQKGWLFALDMATGDVVWRREVSQGPVGSPAGRVIAGRWTVFVCAQKGLLQAFDCSGDAPIPLWTFQMPHEVLGSPVIEEGTEHPLLFLGSKFGNLIAVDARTGEERWQRMAGNWIDNSACVAEVDGQRVVFAGSHDYNVYALRTSDGEMIWRSHLAGEVYSAPVCFTWNDMPVVAVCSLDNHLYLLGARDGRLITSFFTGQPIWDKVNKGETVWGSPAALEAGPQTALVHGSFNDTVYVLPLNGPNTLRAKVQSSAVLWYGLGIVFLLFAGIILPILLLLPPRRAQD